MPMNLAERLPLPSLRVYAAGSVALLAAAAYHAAGVTSDPARRANSSLKRESAGAASSLEPLNATRNFTEQAFDIVSFMIQEPVCMWTVINFCYCVLMVGGAGIQRAVFGRLRVAEATRVKDKLWNYVFYKFIFVFGVVNVQYMDEVLLWCCWFTIVGFLNLLAHLCKDRFEYVCVWGDGGGGGGAGGGGCSRRLAALAAALVAASLALLAVAARALPHDPHTFAFMVAEALLVLVLGAHVVARAVLALRRAEPAAPPAYYTQLAFDAAGLVVELCHVAHMVWYSRLLLSVPALVLLLQLRQLLHRLQLRMRRHTRYRALHHHMSRHYPMASKEEVEKHQDNCAICWEPMREARKLPCHHLFHNSCLCQWVQQDASCPTCRRALRAAAPPPAAPAAAPSAAAPAPPPLRPLAPDHLFRFDGSRYASWLPSFSVEVRRSRGAEPAAREEEPAAPEEEPAAPEDEPAAPEEEPAAPEEEPAPPPPLSAAPSHRDLAAPSIPVAAPAPASPPPSAAPSQEMLNVQPSFNTETEARSSSHAAPVPGSFLPCAAEREELLRRRQALLVEAARRRYLARRSPPAPIPGPAERS